MEEEGEEKVKAKQPSPNRIASRKFFLICVTVFGGFFLAIYQKFDPTILVSSALAFYFGANVMQKR